MAAQDSIRYLRVSTYCGMVPLAFNAAVFLFWCLFRSDVLVVTWFIAFLVGLAVVLVGTICLIVATVPKILRKHSSWPISGLRTLATAAILLSYFPTSAITAASYLQLSREPSVDILEAAGRKNYRLEEVRQFLDNDPTSVNARDDDGYTALHHAAMRNREDVAELLISRGADIEIKTAYAGETALHCAASTAASVPIISALIAAGADVNARSRHGNTPLHIAAEPAEIEAVKALLEHGADVNAMNGEGKTPLDLASDQLQIQLSPTAFDPERWRECIRLLRRRGAISANSEQPHDPASPD